MYNVSGKDKYRIYLSPPHQNGRELEYLSRALESNWLAPGGEYVHEFEAQLCLITQKRYCVGLNSGTAAIHLALKALHVGQGDYVICQSFSFVATANPIVYLGAIPVFIDSEPDSWNMDPVLLEESLNDLAKQGIKPKAIIYAYIYGNPAKVNELLAISEKFNIPLIGDAAEALGSTIDTLKQDHNIISILSFNGNKVITTSGGGAVVTNNKEIAVKVRHLATQARDTEKPYLHTEIGYNYQMSNISASLGLAQLTSLGEWVSKKRAVFEGYKVIQKNIPIRWVKEIEGSYSNRWLSAFLFESAEQREKVQKALKSHGIENRRLWKPLHSLSIYTNKKSYVSGIANQLFLNGICLPSGVGLDKKEQDEIIEIITTAE